jgi:hypothetical protein
MLNVMSIKGDRTMVYTELVYVAPSVFPLAISLAA